MYANILGPHGSTAEETDDELHISEQLKQYLREPLIDRQTGQPLEWWKQNTSRLHLLAQLARKFLCPPPSSVPSERVFSVIGNIYDDKRSRLTGEHAEQLCFLHDNLRFLNWEYWKHFQKWGRLRHCMFTIISFKTSSMFSYIFLKTIWNMLLFYAAQGSCFMLLREAVLCCSVVYLRFCFIYKLYSVLYTNVCFTCFMFCFIYTCTLNCVKCHFHFVAGC